MSWWIYKSCAFHFLRVKKTRENWVSMKKVNDGLGAKNMPDLILKEIYGMYDTKKFTNEQVKK